MRVLVIDQFDICREGMKAVLLQMDKECIFLEAATIEEGITIARNSKLDMVTIDLDVPGIGAFGMLTRIKSSSLKGVVVVSISADYQVMRRAYEMGVCAFIGLQMKKEIAISVFQIVLAGGKYFSPEVIGGEENHAAQFPAGKLLIDANDRPILSNRQMEVLTLLAEGKPNKVIARELEIATGTVKVHIAGILKSLKAKNRTQAVSIANHINIL
ncbi:MAG: response regulator transcription factor [Alphaproteobacteria bacterium]|nr:response regulator transcription factor [Alphaproteobacteria bacterium]